MTEQWIEYGVLYIDENRNARHIAPSGSLQDAEHWRDCRPAAGCRHVLVSRTHTLTEWFEADTWKPGDPVHAEFETPHSTAQQPRGATNVLGVGSTDPAGAQRRSGGES